MAAKNKRTKRVTTPNATAPGPGAPQHSSLYTRASQHRDELLEEARSLMATGRIREARAVEGRAGQVGQLLGALESEIRQNSHAPGAAPVKSPGE